jgi:hypothetical protein
VVCAALLLALSGSAFAAGTGTVDRSSGWFQAGTNLTVTATPGAYSIFDRWAGETNGTAITGAQISFSVTSPRSITAVFKDRLTLTNAVPYWWLAGVGITTNYESAVAADSDGDGFTTAQEYWAGTDPTNSASYLQISGMQINSTNYRLIWAHSHVDAGLPDIAIQSRASLSTGSWSTIGAHPPADGINFVDVPGQLSAFYRLCVTNMP